MLQKFYQLFIGVSLLIKNNVKFKSTCALVFSLIVISSAVSVYESSVNTKSIDYPGAPQNIKLKLYSEYEIDADYYDDLLSVIKYSKNIIV